MGVIIGQIDRLPHQPDFGTIDPGLADAGVQNRGFDTGIGADQLDHRGTVNVFNRRRTNIGRPVANRQARAIGAAFDMAAKTLNNGFQRKDGFNRGEITDQAGNLLAFYCGSHRKKRFCPTGFSQLAVFTDIGGI